MMARLTTMFAVLAALLAPMVAEAQTAGGGRFRVLVPYFQPLEGANRGWGEGASEELRKLMQGLLTHEPIAKDDLEDEVKRFDMNMRDLDCIRARQLAGQINAQVAVCATYKGSGERQFEVAAEVWDIASGESFSIDPFTVSERERQAAAQRIFDAFDRYNTQVRSAAICADYAASQQWENALRNCDEALAINPGAFSVRYQRARILYEMEDYPASLTELEAVLEVNPFHEDALQLAGYISAVQGQDDAAREYYSKYLELQPGNAAIRMRIAYDLAQAGDPVGAMQFIQVGLDVDPDNDALLEQYAGFAFAAANEAQQEAALDAPQGQEVPLTPEAQQYYRQAISAYERVLTVKGEETPVGHLRNIIAGHIQLGDLPAAIQTAERVLQTHGQEESIWLIYADALERSGQLDQAITALGRLREINPNHPTAALRQGNWLIRAGRIDDAVNILSTAASGDPQQAEQAGRLIFNEAYTNGYQKDNFTYAANGLAAAKRLPNLPAAFVNQLNFWHGFSLYQGAVKEQEPQTLASAQSTLPKFQEAIRLLNQSGGYPASVNVNLAQLLENANTYVEIQDAIVRRGR